MAFLTFLHDHWLAGLLLWAISGFLGWSWANYCAYKEDGEFADRDPNKWIAFVICLFIGPLAALANLIVSLGYYGRVHFGLRFR